MNGPTKFGCRSTQVQTSTAEVLPGEITFWASSTNRHDLDISRGRYVRCVTTHFIKRIGILRPGHRAGAGLSMATFVCSPINRQFVLWIGKSRPAYV